MGRSVVQSVLAIVVLAAAASAQAATADLETSPAVVSPDAPWVEYRLALTADAGAEHVLVRSPVALSATGPAEVSEIPLPIPSLVPAPTCADGTRPTHGALLTGQRHDYDVALPDGAQEMLVGAARVRPRPLAADVASDLALPFEAGTNQEGAPLTTLSAPVPAYDGLLGVRMLITGAEPRPPYPNGPPATSVRRGSSVVITGRVFAPLAGDLVSLIARRQHGGRPQLIARTPIRPDNTIAYRWHPTRRGSYAVNMVYAHPRPGYLRDTSDCSLAINVAP